MIHKYITVGGSGTRMKDISHVDKQNLYYYNKQIIEWILEIFPDAKIVGENKTESRKETLKLIPIKDNVLIIDCDIIPFGIDLSKIDINSNCVYVFNSNKDKYGSIILKDNKIYKTSERDNISNIKCSGIYFCKNLEKNIEEMEDNSIVSSMNGANVVFENTFKRLGDIQDYYEAIGI